MTTTAIKTAGEGRSSDFHINWTGALGPAPKHPNGKRWNKGAAKTKSAKHPRMTSQMREEYKKLRRKVGSVEAARALGLNHSKAIFI